MQAVRVGTPLVSGVSAFEEGVHYNYTIGGHTLTIVTTEPNDAEIRAVQRGQALFALTQKENAIFILSRFGHLGWKATHYNWWINAPVMRPDPWDDMEKLNDGLSASVCLVNAINGLVAALRTVKFSRELSRQFIEMVQGQMRPPFDPWRYLEIVDETIQGHPNPGTLLKDALCMCMANLPAWEPFHPGPRAMFH
jgi:hypothetical protein